MGKVAKAGQQRKAHARERKRGTKRREQHRSLGHGFDGIRLDANIAEFCGDAEVVVELAHLLDGEEGSVSGVEAFRILTEGAGDISELVAPRRQVVFHDVRQDNSVCEPVMSAEVSAHWMGHGVHIAEPGLREGDARQHAGDEHTFRGLQFMVVCTGEAQIVADELDGGHDKLDARLPYPRGVVLHAIRYELARTVEDVLAFLPSDLPQPFTNRQLSEGSSYKLSLAGKMTYCMARMGALDVVGKKGNAQLFAQSA